MSQPTAAQRLTQRTAWSTEHYYNGTPCLEWNGAMAGDYGHFRVAGRSVLTHRWMYEASIGPIYQGLVVDHLCRNRACCNPLHLEPVTHLENVRRGRGGYNREKSHCPQGHPYDEANTYRRVNGWRKCRACY